MIVLRRIFPSKTECPDAACRCTRFAPAGKSRSGSLIYRRCAACGVVYRVPPIAEERDEGGAWSKVVALS